MVLDLPCELCFYVSMLRFSGSVLFEFEFESNIYRRKLRAHVQVLNQIRMLSYGYYSRNVVFV